MDSAIDSYAELHNSIIFLAKNLTKMKKEVIDIFNLFAEYKVKIPTSEIALIYQAYNQENKNELVFNELNPFIRTNTDKLFSSWEDIIKTLPNKLDAPLEFPTCDSIIRFLRQTVQSLIHEEMSLRKCKNCNKALLKALYLSTLQATGKWTQPIRNWGKAYGEFSIMYEGRMPL